MNKLLTQINLFEDEGGYKGFGPLGLIDKSPTEGGSIFTTFLSSAIGLISLIGVIWFVFTLILGGVGMITSGGDKQASESARKKITSGLIGLVVIIAGLFLIDFIGTLFGIPEILNVTDLISTLSIQ
jgi:hypothetical protein